MTCRFVLWRKKPINHRLWLKGFWQSNFVKNNFVTIKNIVAKEFPTKKPQSEKSLICEVPRNKRRGNYPALFFYRKINLKRLVPFAQKDLVLPQNIGDQSFQRQMFEVFY